MAELIDRLEDYVDTEKEYSPNNKYLFSPKREKQFL
jgi:hypothetical protein